MPLSLGDITRLAATIVVDEDPRIHVIAAMSAEGATDYAEVVLTREAEGGAPRRLVIGVTRDASEAYVLSVLRDRLRDRLRTLV
ncbi:MAG TPA: hypothetical protein VGJ29_13195 [Vicinamibacterales bacterium]|jgi:hypothetical protein